MIFVWIGIALLSASWLFGLGYYHPADWTAWAVTVATGTVCLLPWKWPLPTRREAGLAMVLFAPAVVFSPWPYRAAPLLIVFGLGLRVLPSSFRIPARCSCAAILGGCLLLAQSLGMFGYTALTARQHELPAPLPRLLGGVARLLRMDAAVFENTISLHSMRKVHLLGATWELLLDPSTFCFLIAGTIVIGWRMATLWTPARRWPALRALVVFLAVIGAWLPLRAGILMSLFLHTVLRTEYDEPLSAMRLFWNSGIQMLLLLVPVGLAWRVMPRAKNETVPDALERVASEHVASERAASERAASERATSEHAFRKRVIALLLVFVAVALITAGAVWEPVGTRKAGRVVVEEFHPDPEKVWERTDKPFDTEWYGHLSGYNYYCIYDYCARFFHMSRLTKEIDDAALRDCDVMIIKVPTRPYSRDEIRSLRGFVEAGGGLMLIGEHTNVFHSTEYLNPIAKQFGFRFRDDCLFGIDKVFEQRYDPPLVPHPILQHMPPMDFATSCSIQPTTRWGRTVIRDTGLKNLLADYHADNFYPQPDDDAEMRYGAFVQLWATRYGRGRVVAFSDSTIFSNFSTFEPGKSELMMGMIQWLNHRPPLFDPRPWLIAAGSLLLIGGLFATQRWRGGWLLCLGAGVLGWCVAASGARTLHAISLGPPRPERPFVQVVMDRTVCSSPLPTNGFISGEPDRFGIFERWILRLGYFTARRSFSAGGRFTARPSGSGFFDGDLIVFPYPDQPLPSGFRDRLVEFVGGGGKVLVIDSPINDQSVTNQLLQPFGLSVDGSTAAEGPLELAADWPVVPVSGAKLARGGTPFARLDGKPVGTSIKHGDGLVVLVGFGARLTDDKMGITGDVEPDEDLRQVFDLQFKLLRTMVETKPAAVIESP